MSDAADIPVDVAIGSGVDDAQIPPDAAVCFGGSLVTVCLQAPPTIPRMITDSVTIDTSDTSMCAATASVKGGDVCVLAGTTITISAALRAIGAKPLVLVASESISVLAAGTVDVASRIGLPPGAGANPSGACSPTMPPTSGNSTSGGGAGGSFAAAGGGGGFGAGAGGGRPGIPAGSQGLSDVRGGCPGQDGAGTRGGMAGSGGGAVFLIAGEAINVSGTIVAGGAGGGGGAPSNGGGGGGGSGGLIGFFAPQIIGGGFAIASGGGGGEAAGASAALVGRDGKNGLSLLAADGGSGGADTGGDGGAGSSPTSPVGQTGLNAVGAAGGGGGGGGGEGYIRSNTSLDSIQTSPAPTVVP